MIWQVFKLNNSCFCMERTYSAGITGRYKSSGKELTYSPETSFSLTLCLQMTYHPDCWFSSPSLFPAFVSIVIIPLCSFHGIAASTAGSWHVLQSLGNWALQKWTVVKWRVLNIPHYSKEETEVKTEVNRSLFIEKLSNLAFEIKSNQSSANFTARTMMKEPIRDTSLIIRLAELFILFF